MTINIYTVLNGVGLEQDANIIKSLLGNHKVRIIDILRNPLPMAADVNIFLEIIRAQYLRTAPKNYFFPNPEWFDSAWIKYLNDFTSICCKTIDALNIFNQFTKKLIYTGFTSQDCYNKSEERRPQFLHVAGKSETKNTGIVSECYQKHKDLPLLFLLQHKNRSMKSIPENVTYVTDYVPPVYFKKVQNTIQYHICTSQYEGFGHYLNEARSVKAVIISTDAAPMNELIDDSCGVLIPVANRTKQQLGILNHISANDLYRGLKRVEQMSDAEVEQKSNTARERFLKGDQFFKETFIQIIEL